jgi:hypothetical protein
MHCIHMEQRLQVLLDASVLQAFVAFMEKERSARSKKISTSHEWITPTLMCSLTLIVGSYEKSRRPTGSLGKKKKVQLRLTPETQFVGCASPAKRVKPRASKLQPHNAPLHDSSILNSYLDDIVCSSKLSQGFLKVLLKI